MKIPPEKWVGAFMLGNQDVDASFLTLEMTWFGMRDQRIKDQIGLSVPDTFEEIIDGSTINTYVLAKPIIEFVNRAVDCLQNKSGLLKELKEKTVSTARGIREYAERHIENLSDFNIENLADMLLEIRKLQADCVAYGTVVAWADITGAISQSLTDVLLKKEGLKYPRHWYTHVLGSPETPSLTEQAVKEIRKSNNSHGLLKKYFWLNQGYIGTGLSVEEINSLLGDKGKDETEIEAGADELNKELNLSSQEAKSFEISRDIIFIKSLRADSRQFLHVLVNRIVMQLSRFWNIGPELISVMSATEIYDLIKNKKPLPENLSDRLKHSVMIPAHEKYEILIGSTADGFVKQILQGYQVVDSKEIKGQVAYQGFVQGTVRLVFGPQHNDKVKVGDVLVSTATSPQLLPAMMRAVAFVTDVGGITSHAAIVARELKKPCIVGTKFATQVLKNGDLVEVDANKGIVRRLS